MSDAPARKVALVIGAGDATGSAIARRFAREGYVACLTRRSADIESRLGPIEVFVFNIGANVPSSILDETPRKFFKVWEMACFAGFLTSQAVAKRMAARRHGTLLFTGATAALRGSANSGP